MRRCTSQCQDLETAKSAVGEIAKVRIRPAVPALIPPVNPAPAFGALPAHLRPLVEHVRTPRSVTVVVTGGHSHETQMASQRLVSSWDAISAKWAWVELNYRPHAYQAQLAKVQSPARGRFS
jgi:hypothetical protein